MPWNPEVYNQFKQIRYKPFFDLANLISGQNLTNAVDIGCGTGEQTALLSEKFKAASFLGIDSSEEMLANASLLESKTLHYKLMSIEEFADSDSTWDLVFSNAALQWSDDHHELFPKLISKLNLGGQFAVQMPFQKENVLNQLLLELVMEQPFEGLLKGYVRSSPLLSMDEYAQILFDNGLRDLNISLKVYPLIANNATELYDFISGSALIPYMERLDATGQELLKLVFMKRIEHYFTNYPAIYSFKRVLMYGVRN